MKAHAIRIIIHVIVKEHHFPAQFYHVVGEVFLDTHKVLNAPGSKDLDKSF